MAKNDYTQEHEKESYGIVRCKSALNIENGAFEYINENIAIPLHLSEHFETVGPILEKVLKMPNPVITKDEIIKLKSSK